MPRLALVIPADAITLSIHNVNPVLYSIDGYFDARNKNTNCPLFIFLDMSAVRDLCRSTYMYMYNVSGVTKLNN